MKLASYRSTLSLSPGQRCILGLWTAVLQPVSQWTICARLGISVALLRVFGARIGREVVWKGGVRVSIPWNLTVGDHVWVGESVWLDSLAPITIGSNVCISQGAYLCTGNHDRRSEGFDLMLRPITLEDEVWVGAFCLLAPGTLLKAGSVCEMGVRVKGVVDEGMVVCGLWGEARGGRTREVIMPR